MVIGALTVSGDAMAARRDQSVAGRPGREAVRKPAMHRAQAMPHRAGGKRHGLATHRRNRAVAVASSGGISCVPYARAVSGLQVTGNGGDWWGNAAGLYDRGHRPEPGAVMAFRATSGMSRGHVAVVRRIVSPREVLIDHANWAGPGIRRGSVMQGVSVIDVSDANDWSAVKVQVGYDNDSFGRTYPTFGFIYNRPDDGVNTGTAYAGMQLRSSARYEQVAEAPEGRGFALQGLQPLRSAQAMPRR
ncbi:CHAP domain-containing protein [Belnapia sp. T6]|uniref:CHAP domain-containing protein n=2 Tax=Belnapia mucosa TaxID=2804532 RepID=A0ABS1V882_9PROT|nr:CHAP domain-containing protein [Belnapia mucosa]